MTPVWNTSNNNVWRNIPEASFILSLFNLAFSLVSCFFILIEDVNQAHLERGRQRGHWAGLYAPPCAEGVKGWWSRCRLTDAYCCPACDNYTDGVEARRNKCPVFVIKVNEVTRESPHTQWDKKSGVFLWKIITSLLLPHFSNTLMVNNADSWFVAATLKDSDDEDDGRSIQQQIYSS